MATVPALDPWGNPIVILTIKEVASYLRIHPSTVYKLVKRHKIPAFKIGSDWRFHLESIDRWRLGEQGTAD